MRDVFAPAAPPHRSMPDVLQPEAWLAHLFGSKSAITGGVVRRKLSDLERIVGWGPFRAELKRRGYRAVVNGGQVVIFCNAEPVRIVD